MNIAIDARSSNLHAGSGIGTYTKNLVLNLIDNIDTNFELIWTGNYKYLLPKKDNLNIHITSGHNNNFFENYYVPNLLNEKKIDLFHIPQNGIGIPIDCDIDIVVTIHDLIPYIMPETVGKGYLERFLRDMPKIINKSKGIITVSEYSKKDILRFFPNCDKNKIFVTPLAANSNFKPLNKDNCKKILKEKFNIYDDFCLYLGGFSPRKNVKGLIDSYKKIYSSLNKKIKLLIGGALRDDGLKLKEYVKSIGQENNIIFVGYIDDSYLPIFYNCSKAFIYPSFYEGFGLPPLEAMSCKCPVITSNISSIPEVTLNNALLFDPSNIDDLSSSMLTLLNNDSLQEEYSERGFKRSLEFSWKKTSDLTLENYKKIKAL